MSTTSEYLQQLQTDKQNLVDNLVTKGVSATSNETFTSLVPKVLDIQSGGTDAEITDASYLFYYGARLDYLEEILTLCKNVTSCESMFDLCGDELTQINLSNFDTSNVTSMSGMFSGCYSLTNLDLSNFDTAKVTRMASMFQQCSSLANLNLSNFNTSYVTGMGSMFYGCRALKNIDLSSFNTALVTSMSNMFNGCSALESVDLSSFNTLSINNNHSMFQNCTSLIKVIINRQDVFKMTSTSMLSNTPIANGTGYVYVPDNMVETYKSATNWSTYADQIKGMSELLTEEA